MNKISRHMAAVFCTAALALIVGILASSANAEQRVVQLIYVSDTLVILNECVPGMIQPSTTTLTDGTHTMYIVHGACKEA